MREALLFWTYSAVMVAALACFIEAFRARRTLKRHKRMAGLGVILTLGGIAVVLLVTYLFGWRVPKRYPDIVRIHRALAVGAAVLVVVTAWTGWRRVRWHKRLYVVFFPLYIATIVTALIGYKP